MQDCEVCSGETDGTGTIVDIDSDGDGVAECDEIVGCTDESADNYSIEATEDGDCVFLGCTDENALNYDLNANTDDGSCIAIVEGCTDGDVNTNGGVACNYDSNANTDNGSCEYSTCSGCLIESACNYDATVTISNNDMCEYPLDLYGSSYVDCEGNCLNDTDSDGVCDEEEVFGCTDSTACNYVGEDDDTTDTDNSLCEFAELYYDCDGNCINDSDGDEVCDDLEILGCTDGDPETNLGVACNYVTSATEDDGSCEYDSCSGCNLADACNYDNTITIIDNNSCIYPDQSYLNCNGDCINDIDGDGVCNEVEVTGCTDSAACNYVGDDDDTTDSDDNLCEYAEENFDCDGNCIIDVDCAGNCGGSEEIITYYIDSDGDGLGYDGTSTDLCSSFPQPDGYVLNNFDPCPLDEFNDSDGDGICDSDEVTGCTDSTACNYVGDDDDTTNTDDNLCEYAEENFDCDGNCIVAIDCAGNCGGSAQNIIYYIDTDGDGLGDDSTSTELCSSLPQPDGFVIADLSNLDPCPLDEFNDSDGDGICDSDEVTGCTDSTACNYVGDDDNTTDADDTLCKYIDGICETCIDGNIIDNDTDNDGVCDNDEVFGCTDPSGCNYVGIDDITTDTNNDLCIYVDGICETCVNGQIVDNDSDNDGVCNDNEIFGCTDALACNYVGDDDDTTDTDNSQCIYAVDNYDCDGNCINDTDGDGVCNEFEISGCVDITACNFDSEATDDNGSCTFIDGVCETCEDGVIVDNDSDDDGVCDDDEVLGCTDEAACNYSSLATDDNGLCTFIDGICESCENGFIVDNDSDDDGVCDNDEVLGCTDPSACNYVGDEDDTTDSDNSLCTYPTEDYLDCNGVCLNDSDLDGTCDENEVPGCTDPSADNFSDDATEDDDSCIFLGCIDDSACNYDITANTDDGTCTYPTEYLDCDGFCLNDSDLDGTCDENEVPGCTDDLACNFNEDATDENDSCEYAEEYYDCNGVCLNDSDLDGTCDENEVPGCIDSLAFNFNPNATENDGSCIDVILGCTNELAFNYESNANTDDASCCFISGCLDPNAFNYNSTACFDNESCIPVILGCTDSTAINYNNSANTDDDSCISYIYGCIDDTACNYNTVANSDDGSCTYIDGVCETCSGATDGTGTIVDNDLDNDGVCDDNEVLGCTDEIACNYDSDTTTDTDNSLCVYSTDLDNCATCSGETDGTGTVVDNDLDNDGVCDGDELLGCTDETACNYDSNPTTDTNNLLCLYTIDVCDTCSGEDDGTGFVVDNDTNNNGVCDDDETPGCIDPLACNYNPEANTDDGSCEDVFDIFGENGILFNCDGSCVDGYIYSEEEGTCIEVVEGCTDPTAVNFNSNATLDDDSCIAYIYGCTDLSACNYNELANTGDGSCTYTDGVCDTCENGIIVDNDLDNDGVCDDDEVLGCTDETACNYVGDEDLTTDTDNTLCTYVDGICDTCENGLIVDNDLDNDGVCDDDEVLGCTDATACNYDSDPTTDTDNTLCTYVDGICDTCEDGVVVDNDADNDGTCDENEVPGCTDSNAFNFNDDATDDDGSCEAVVEGCIDETAINYNNSANTDDGSCIAVVEGCLDPTACNYNIEANTSDGLCTYLDGFCETCEDGVVVNNDLDNDGVCDDDEVLGCTDSTACNYVGNDDVTTDTDNSLCTYTDGICETCEDGVVVDNDLDNDGVCDDDEVLGCTDATACNYDSDPTTDTDNTLCTYVDGICDTCEDGVVVDNDADNDGTCDENEVPGCTDSNAFNFNDDATDDDGSCEAVVEGCIDETAINYNNSANTDDGSCIAVVEGCLDPTAFNYNPSANTDDGLCIAVVEGCTDVLACNYNSDANTEFDPSTCTYADSGYNCNGECINDIDGDEVCDEFEVGGCNDDTACNFDSSATDNDGTCTYPIDIYGFYYLDCDGDCLNDTDFDGTCDENEILGCNDPTACNFDSSATENDGSCTYPDPDLEYYLDCDGNCINDTDDDGVCDEVEITGCTDNTACNYNPSTTDEDNTVCDYSCYGCTDLTACNYNEDATINDLSLCLYPIDIYGFDYLDCNGDCLNDADADDICDENEILGCTDEVACNYNLIATEDDNSCTYAEDSALNAQYETVVYDCDGNCINDIDGDDVCNENEIWVVQTRQHVIMLEMKISQPILIILYVHM